MRITLFSQVMVFLPYTVGRPVQTVKKPPEYNPLANCGQKQIDPTPSSTQVGAYKATHICDSIVYFVISDLQMPQADFTKKLQKFHTTKRLWQC
jgi:hypothetical protein